MTKKTLIQIRTNSNFSVNYQDLTLSPEVELIMLFTEPDYTVNKKMEIAKSVSVDEFRIKTDIAGVGRIISELQALQNQLLTFENLSGMLNSVIKSNTKPKE